MKLWSLKKNGETSTRRKSQIRSPYIPRGTTYSTEKDISGVMGVINFPSPVKWGDVEHARMLVPCKWLPKTNRYCGDNCGTWQELHITAKEPLGLTVTQLLAAFLWVYWSRRDRLLSTHPLHSVNNPTHKYLQELRIGNAPIVRLLTGPSRVTGCDFQVLSHTTELSTNSLWDFVVFSNCDFHSVSAQRSFQPIPCWILWCFRNVISRLEV